MKSLAALVSVTLPVPAFRALVPVTANGPFCVMLPLPLVALRLPPTVEVPRFKAPVLLALRLPVAVTVPSVSALASARATLAPSAETAPMKSLAALVSVTLPVPAFSVVVPPATMVVPAA